MTEIKNHFLNKFSEKLTSLQKLCTFCSLEVSLDLLRLTISLPEFIVKAMHLLVNVSKYIKYVHILRNTTSPCHCKFLYLIEFL